MNVGTKSILFGVHCPLIHTWTMAIGWWRLYRFEPAFPGVRWPGLLDPRLWVAFIVHDLGYWGKPNMDGTEGERHPDLGASIMRRLFGDEWGDFCLLHSRFYAKTLGRQPSRLCAADKMAMAATPWWLYLPLSIWSGEIVEYLAVARKSPVFVPTSDPISWYRFVANYCERWAREHACGKRDTWTTARNSSPGGESR